MNFDKFHLLFKCEEKIIFKAIAESKSGNPIKPPEIPDVIVVTISDAAAHQMVKSSNETSFE